jgi:uncharacterized membrane protein
MYLAVCLMGKYEWLLFLHMTGAFLFLGGLVMAIVLGVAAQRRERPSEIALLFKLTARLGLPFGLGFFMLFVFGLWLVHVGGYSFRDGWVIGALVLFVLSMALGAIAGPRDKATRMLAEELAAAGDQPSPALKARLRDPVTLALGNGSALAALAVLVLMIWKPGAGG